MLKLVRKFMKFVLVCQQRSILYLPVFAVGFVFETSENEFGSLD